MKGEGRRPVAVAVDAYTSANFLPPAFARHGADMIHLQTTPELFTRMAPPRPELFGAFLVLDDDDATIARLAAYDPICIIPGQEYGVPAADRLSERMGLPGNGTALSRARRDKYEMVEVVRAAGLHCARQIRSGDVAEILDWIGRTGCLPCVVKPLASASTDGVTICTAVEEVGPAVAAVLAVDDIFGDPNREVVVQSFLDGPEYYVDTVSRDGRHAIVGVGLYDKKLLPGGRRIYDRDIMVGPEDGHARAVADYALAVLDAFQVRHGPSHIEVIVTADGPALVEIGTRVNGNLHPEFQDLCLGTNQADLTALAYVDPDRFALGTAARDWTPRQPAELLHVAVDQEGTVAALDPEVTAEIEGLPTVFAVQFKLTPGKRVQPTIDLLTSPIRVFMTGGSAAAIAADRARIEALKHRVHVLS